MVEEEKRSGASGGYRKFESDRAATLIIEYTLDPECRSTFLEIIDSPGSDGADSPSLTE
ncbi:hypothetical protein [Microcoleus sp. bin38.metabat.b11b12b14.051]|uniref:hypothetical protein n=1 Tax=Microcoleus sp. bin38.metabat.b11b12b14.051 TaxID=2742709 RepID=UPI0025E484C1|nr:hypothetical protein [Microcoleus sp. bin38.metabat.b11b12b14.051]